MLLNLNNNPFVLLITINLRLSSSCTYSIQYNISTDLNNYFYKGLSNNKIQVQLKLILYTSRYILDKHASLSTMSLLNIR